MCYLSATNVLRVILEKQPAALKDCSVEYWCEKARKHMGRCTGSHYMSDNLLETTSNSNQSIFSPEERWLLTNCNLWKHLTLSIILWYRYILMLLQQTTFENIVTKEKLLIMRNFSFSTIFTTKCNFLSCLLHICCMWHWKGNLVKNTWIPLVMPATKLIGFESGWHC